MTLIPPTVEQQRMIDKDLPPDPEMRKQDVAAIKEWLNKQPHLPKHFDDDRLEKFLFGCKNNVERCKVVLENFFTVRSTVPDIFHDRDPLAPGIQACFDCVYMAVLPKLTQGGHRVTVVRLRSTDSEKFSIAYVVKTLLMIGEILISEEKTPNILILDMWAGSAKHFAHTLANISVLKKTAFAMQNGLPQRLHTIHFLNVSSLLDNVLKLVFPFMKAKLIRKIKLHQGQEELLDLYDKEILPNEYGGTVGSLEEISESWRQGLVSRRDWFLREQELSKSDETKRLPTSKSMVPSELEGVHGSFRLLDVD